MFEKLPKTLKYVFFINLLNLSIGIKELINNNYSNYIDSNYIIIVLSISNLLIILFTLKSIYTLIKNKTNWFIYNLMSNIYIFISYILEMFIFKYFININSIINKYIDDSTNTFSNNTITHYIYILYFMFMSILFILNIISLIFILKNKKIDFSK